jgi:hypothetical protein
MFRDAMNGKLAEHGGNRKSETEHDQGDDVTLITERGNSNAYWQARIQRDCPEELEKIKRGEKEILDVRKERGWVPKTKRVTLTGDPNKDKQRLINAWGEDYLERLRK